MSREEDQQWDEVMALAKQYSLIVGSYGGVTTLAHPDEQRKNGIREKCLWMNNGGTMADAADQARREDVRAQQDLFGGINER